MPEDGDRLMLPLPQALFLLDRDARSGKRHSRFLSRRHLAHGSVLAELVLAQRVEISEASRFESAHLAVGDRAPTGDSACDAALEWLGRRRRPVPLRGFLQAGSLTSGGRKLEAVVMADLVERSIVKMRKQAFPRGMRFQELNSTPRSDLQRAAAAFRARDVGARETRVHEPSKAHQQRTELLIALSCIYGSLGELYSSAPTKETRHWARSLARANPTGASISQGLDEIQRQILVRARN